MERAFFGGRETLRSATAIGWHRVEAHRPLPIRRERDASAVGSPDGALIVTLERKLLDLRVASKVVEPEDATVIFHRFHHQLVSVG